MRLLILAYDFPPNTSVGAQRPYGWFRYLKEFGIHPVVVTRHWDEVRQPKDTIKPCGTEVTVTESELGTIIRVPFRPNLRDRMLLRFGDRFPVPRKILSLWFTVAQYFVASADNRRNMYQAAREYLKDNPCNAVIATGEPFILFHYANMLSKDFKIPWVADYRDGWSNNYLLESAGSSIERAINILITSPLEHYLTRTPSSLTAATPVLSAELSKKLVKNVRPVLNGYFEESFDSLYEDEFRAPGFTIVYSGSLYAFQPLETFLEGVEMLISDEGLKSGDLTLLFIGMDFQTESKNRLLNFNPKLIPHIKTTPRCSHAETVKLLHNADMMLVLAGGPFQPIPAKLYDYMAIGKPILLCTSDNGPVEKILSELGNGLIADNAAEVRQQISGFKNGSLMVSRPDSESLKRYSRRYQASILANLIKTTLKQ